IFTGYTNCPDICPNTLNDMTHLYSKLKEASRKRFQFTFFSVDPNRDTPQRMKSYLDNFHSDFIGISGKKEEIDNVIHQLGGIYSLNTDEGEYYSVDHSGRIFIVDPMSRRYGILKAEALHSKNKDQLVKELESLL
ncbi:MAG: SCO family protein, partial [Kangiellaceae bacterium]